MRRTRSGRKGELLDVRDRRIPPTRRLSCGEIGGGYIDKTVNFEENPN